MAKIIDFPVDRARPPELSPEEIQLGEMLFERLKGRHPSGAKKSPLDYALRIRAAMVKMRAQEGE